jgi:hypothetical protein
MIKVRILKGVTAAGAAAVAFPQLVGCAADPADASPETASDTQDNTAAIAGSGVLALHGWSLEYKSTSGGDEFLRVGEKMKMTVDFQYLVMLLGYRDSAAGPAINNDPTKLKAIPKLTYTKYDGSTSDVALPPVTWKQGASNITYGESDEFVIPAGIKRMKIEVGVEYTTSAPQRIDLLQAGGIQTDFVVFGAFTPNKLALFDTVGGGKRTRVVEGGGLVKGANVTFTVTDWRLDTLVDRMTLDTYIGDQQNYNRFGPSIVAANGQVEYEVEAVVSTDGGRNYKPLGLSKAMKPDVFQRAEGWRFAFQAETGIPRDATGVKIAFHVKAFLQVPQFGSIINPRYSPGQRVLLKDVWDNNGGQDYALPVVDR